MPGLELQECIIVKWLLQRGDENREHDRRSDLALDTHDRRSSHWNTSQKMGQGACLDFRDWHLNRACRKGNRDSIASDLWAASPLT